MSLWSALLIAFAAGLMLGIAIATMHWHGRVAQLQDQVDVLNGALGETISYLPVERPDGLR